MCETLIFAMFFISQTKHWPGVVYAHAFNDEQLSRHIPQLANHAEWVFQMIEQTKAENEVEGTMPHSRYFLDITDVDAQFGHPLPSLFRVLRPAPQCRYFAT